MVKQELVFGIPSTRTRNLEKYPNTPVLTLHPVAGKGTARKFELNRKAVEVLGLKLEEGERINFSFTDGKAYFTETGSFDPVGGFTLTKTATFSNKKMYDYISELFELNQDRENDLLLSIVNSEERIAEVSVMEKADSPNDENKEEVHEPQAVERYA